jgi:hypothetical protein
MRTGFKKTTQTSTRVIGDYRLLYSELGKQFLRKES